MKVLTKPLFVLFAFFFISLMSCTVDDITTDTVETISSDPDKKDLDPPSEDPND